MYIERPKKTSLFVGDLLLAFRVTRFGEILPFWHNIKSLGQIVEGLFRIWQNIDPTVEKMFYHWASFHCYRWPNT